MKSKLVFLFVLGFSLVVNSQKKYTFDYMVEYESQRTEKSKKKKEIILTNSHDVSYKCYLFEKNNSSFQMYFEDEEVCRSWSTISKVDFYKSGTLILPCNSVEFYKPYKYKINYTRYDIANTTDTLIEGKYYKQYEVVFHSQELAKSLDFGKTHVILENNTGYEQPLFTLFDMPEVTQEAIKMLPNGIPREFYFLTYNNKHKKFISKLINYEKTDIDLVITDECLVSKGLQSK